MPASVSRSHQNGFTLTFFRRKKDGFTLIEFIIATALLAIVITALFQVILGAVQSLGLGKVRLTAQTLADEQMELARNLSYTNVGTIGGIPSGTLAQQQVKTINGADYTIKTSVVYIDDPFDSVAPTDTLPTDYKRVRIEVSWNGAFASAAPIVEISDIAPNGVENNSSGGILKILVFNAQGLPVSQAQVHITNTQVTPNIDLTINSDSNGQVLLPGSPPCSSCYNISVTKAGYSTDKTYTPSQVAIPVKPPATVLTGQLTPISFAIDQLSTLTVKTTNDKATNFSSRANTTFHLRGTKTIGDDSASNPVYKVDNDYTTDSSGSFTINNVEWDSYTLSESVASLDLSGTNPLQPFAVAPNTTSTATLAFTTHTTNSLFLSVEDASGSAIASATATLVNTGGFHKDIQTGQNTDPDFGQAFFASLAAGSYSLTATASGYQTATASVTVNSQTNYILKLSQ